MDRKRKRVIERGSRRLVLCCAALLAVLGLVVGAPRADGATATVSVWNITGPIGHNPDASREDVTGITGHVATATNPQSVAVAIDNSNNPQGPCGLIIWNPATNTFKDYGITGGFSSG